jgi:tetratricopeptide (TPR) repeat protein
MARSKSISKPGRPRTRGTRATAAGSRLGLLPFGILFLLAAGIRIAYLAAYGRALPFRDVPIVDAEYYRGWAHALAAGAGPAGVFARAPGYAYFLALVDSLAGPGFTGWVLGIQTALGLSTWALLVLLSHRLWGRTGALATGLLAALCFPFPFFESKLLPTTLSLFLAVASLSLLGRASGSARPERGRRRRETGPGKLAPAAAGLLWGLACLARPNLLVFPFVAIPVGWILTRRVRDGVPPVFWAGLVLALLPATAHNLRAGGEPVLVSANGGMNFAIGHHPGNRTGLFVVPPELGSPATTAALDQAARDRADRESGRTLTASEADRFWLGRGMSFVARHPLAEARLEGTKLLRMLDTEEFPNNYSVEVERETIPWLAWIRAPFWIVFFLAGAGLIRYGRREGRPAPDGAHPSAAETREARARRARLAAILSLAATAVLGMLFFCVMSRFRLFLTAPLLVLAGGGVAALRAWATERGRRPSRAAWGLALLAISLAPTLIPLPLPRSTRAFGYLQAGLAWMEGGHGGRAAPAFEKSLEIERSGDAILGLSRARVAQGRMEEALDLLHRGEKEFPEDPRLPDYRGAALQLAGRGSEAEPAFARALEIDPTFAQASFNLASLYASEGDFARGAAYFRRCLRLDPRDATALYRLGRCYRELGLADSARIAFEGVLRLEPGHGPSLAELRELSSGPPR